MVSELNLDDLNIGICSCARLFAINIRSVTGCLEYNMCTFRYSHRHFMQALGVRQGVKHNMALINAVFIIVHK